MRLYLVRHAIAEEASEGMTDADRRLTPEGIRRMVRAARGLRQLGISPDRIVTSPLRRAQETAAILARVLRPEIAVQPADWLAPGGDAADAIRHVSGAGPSAEVVLVGHQPDLSRLASFLLTGVPGRVDLVLRKGGVAALSTTASSHAVGAPASLEWLLTPKQLRALGKGGGPSVSR